MDPTAPEDLPHAEEADPPGRDRVGFLQRAVSSALRRPPFTFRNLVRRSMTPRAITAGAFFVVSQAAWICVVATDE